MGSVALLNGVEIARDNAPADATAESTAIAPRDDSLAVGDFAEFDISEHIANLEAGSNVLAVHALNDAADSARFLIGVALEATQTGSHPVYFPDPSPGEPNGPGLAALVHDTEFSVDRGFYASPFDVAVTTATPGATIRFTLDGSTPTENSGTRYVAPVRIETTTTLRAMAFRDDLIPTNVDTQTYLFLESVIRQPNRPQGYPTSWAGVPADYEMDPDIVDDPAYADEMVADLEAIPALSVVLDRDDMFGGQRGLYQNPDGRGLAWEREASLELFSADGSESFQENAGVRIHGGAGRRPEHPKKSFRVIFRRRYGAGKLRYPLFENQPYAEGAVESFDKLILRAGFNNTLPHWYDEQVLRAQYVRDQWARDLQMEMGHLAPRGRYVHLYINGLYWGLYNVVERSDEDWGASYMGGEPEDYDVIKNRSVVAGSAGGWTRMQSLATGGVTDAQLDEAEGLVNFQNLADSMLENIWFGNSDWDGNNSVAMRRRSPPLPFIFPNWDSEFAMCLPPGAQPNQWEPILNINRTGVNVSNAGSAIFQGLRRNREFALLLADRVHRMFFNGGTLTPESVTDLWMRRADEVHGPIVGETARWGDYRRDVYSQREPRSNFPLFTRDEHYLEHQRWILEEYFPRRAEIILNQFRSAGYWPDEEPPAFSQYGGTVESGFELEVTSPTTPVFLTTDGSDPRLRGGDVSPTAMITGDIDASQLLEQESAARILIPTSDALGDTWIAPGFDDASWEPGVGAVGYDRNDTYREIIGIDVAEMDSVNPSVYVRVPFDVDNLGEFEILTLRMKYDDGFIAYLGGQEIARRNALDESTWDSAATRSHSDSAAVRFEDIDVSEHRDLLTEGRNVLAIHGMNRAADNSDFLIGWALRTSSPARGTITVTQSTIVKARTFDGETWSPLSEALFSVDSGIRISEVMYHPLAPSDDKANAGFDDQDDFEFLEIVNTGAQVVNLEGWSLSGAVRFTFGETSLGPGARTLVVRDRDAFTVRYGRGLSIAGEYAGRLANDGELIRFESHLGELIERFAYDDAWHPSTDGEGNSLVRSSPDSDPTSSDGWRPSAKPLGTPGESD